MISLLGSARTYANQVYRNAGLRTIPATRPYAWLIRYCSFIVITNYHIRVSGETSRYMLKGAEVQYKLGYFCETVVWKCQDTDKPRSKILPRWQRGIWVGIIEASGQHIVLTRDGAEMSRKVSRLPVEVQWDAKLLTTAAGTPWSKREGARGLEDGSASRSFHKLRRLLCIVQLLNRKTVCQKDRTNLHPVDLQPKCC